MPRIIDYTHNKHQRPTLPGGLNAQSGWWRFFVAAFLGKNFFNLNGRACRSEWWTVTVMSGVVAFILAFVYSAVAIFVFNFSWETASVEELTLFINGGNVINFIVSIPCMSVSFRRFHDLDMSAWWGMLILPNLILPFIKGKPVDNRFGKNIY